MKFMSQFFALIALSFFLFRAGFAHAQTCEDLLSASVDSVKASNLQTSQTKIRIMSLKDPHRAYAVGELVDGVRHVHVVEFTGPVDGSANIQKKVKEIVLKRANFGIYGNDRITSFENNFSLNFPESPQATEKKFQDDAGKRVVGIMYRRYLDLKDIGYVSPANQIPDFVYRPAGSKKLLFRLQVQASDGELINVTYTLHTHPGKFHAMEHALMYGDHLLGEMRLADAAILGGVQFFGEYD